MPLENGAEVEGKITGVAKFGAFVELPEKESGLVHISQISDSFVSDINQHIKVGDIVKVKVMGISKGNKYDLSIKQVGKKDLPNIPYKPRPSFGREKPPANTFEDKITRFLKQSDERQLDLKKNIEVKQGIRKRKKKKIEKSNA